MSDPIESTVILKLTGNRIDKPVVPTLLRSGAARSTRPVADPFLPDDYVRVVEAFDLSPGGRSAPTAQKEVELQVTPGQVLVLELPDGTTLITSGGRLQDELQRVAPEAVSQGAVRLDDLLPRGAASRGLLESLGRLASKVFVLSGGGADLIIDEALDEVRKLAGEALADKLRDGAYWGVTYVATRALMWAIEKRLLGEPGLYRWPMRQGQKPDRFAIDDRRLVEAARQGPLLVFVHGAGSCTTGSFGDLQSAAVEAQRDWDAIEGRYGERIYGFEHRTFSESPIENALLLARTLPKGAQIDLVTHSRGGIVGDLLCVDCTELETTQKLIADYARFRTPAHREAKDLDEADAKDRRDLLALATELREKGFVIGRYVRVAAPANGTLLAGSNLDLFLSGLLTLFGVVTILQASPFYMALKRVVLEIARNRVDANRVPGLEALLPGSALSRLLRLAPPQKNLRLGVIAGDIAGTSRFKRLVAFLADWAIFDRTDNDLVVDTASMAAGLARPENARRLFVQGPRVDHFSYFGNADARAALTGWLTAADPERVPGFDALARRFEEPRGVIESRGGLRAADRPLPVVIVLPGIMGSHLQVNGNRIWFDPLDIARGRLKRIEYTPESLATVSAEKLFEMFYGDLCDHLARTHRVVRCPYDWRRPVQDAAQKLARELRTALDATKDSRLPVRILAHSMGGLVTRALAAAEPALWNEFLDRDSSRFLMLGTPNQGSHAMVATLLGKSDTVRKLAMLDWRHDLQEVLDLISTFRGALQLLPQPGFTDGGTPINDYLQHQVWKDFRPQVFDFWFGDGLVGVPSEAACAEARTLWELPEFETACVPGSHPQKVIYVCGKADNTTCGIQIAGRRVKMLGTPEGDGTVSWASGRIDGIGEAYLMEAAHGDLADSPRYFDALVQLLANGSTGLLPRGWPSAAARGEAAPAAIVYDAGPVAVPTDAEAAASLLGSRGRRPSRARPAPDVLQVSCAAMDVRYAIDPILVGHYEQDLISGAEAVIDRDIVFNELTMRKHIGLYPGAIGTATVVLMEPNAQEQQRRSRRGAVVTGLGAWGDLSAGSLTEAVRSAALRYLLAIVERENGVCAERGRSEPPIDVGLSSLLLGYSSTANISVADSVHAIVRGVLEANRQFAEAQRRGGLHARIVRLEIIECFIDIAISTTKALTGVAQAFEASAAQLGMRVAAAAELKEGPGARPRLEALTGLGHWPRLIVTVFDDGQMKPDAAPASARTGAPLAEKLRYVLLSQRARAETVVHQRQPGLVEKLIKLSIDRQIYDRDLSRTLFQLLVPLDFKEAVRQTDALSLLVDEYTANFPWELLTADDQPVVTRTAMVRQFVTTGWRRRVRSTVDKTAYIIGNPSTEGFAKAFCNEENTDKSDPRPLPGAEAEAYAVAGLLRTAGYEPTESIGMDQRAVDVINRLFQRPYRILHIAAHGEFNIQAVDGSRRSGVLLSDGLMLTAAEIQQMEIVPELVFLNCCHLGQIDGKPVGREVEFNRLASSLARELIDMGVRAVIAAGWAVEDQAGQAFAETFYRCLILEGQTFGMAVQHARQHTYQSFALSNTWGAFQAYGDPGFLIDPSHNVGRGFDEAPAFASARELLDDLERIREGLRQSEHRGRSQTLRSLQRRVDALFGRCPTDSKWEKRGDVLYTLGMLFADFGQEGYERASEYLLRAIEAEEQAARVPIKAIEQLGNMEVRCGDGQDDSESIQRGGERLQLLSQAVAARPGDPTSRPTAERCGLLGSAWKRRAASIEMRLQPESSGARRDAKQGVAPAPADVGKPKPTRARKTPPKHKGAQRKP
jgi:pimeloyl-ACP methyl ester carboxylesterase